MATTLTNSHSLTLATYAPATELGADNALTVAHGLVLANDLFVADGLIDTAKSTVAAESTVAKRNGIYSIIVPVVLAGLLVTPVTAVPTNASQNYTINTHYVKTGQLNVIDFERSNTDIVNSYQSYPLNWDGYDGIPPSAETISDVLSFLEKLPYGVIEPRPGVSGDGEVSLFWENDGIYIDIGFLGDGAYVLYARDSQDIEYFNDSIDLHKPLPAALLNLINIR